jgi:hypothetical protein
MINTAAEQNKDETVLLVYVQYDLIIKLKGLKDE